MPPPQFRLPRLLPGLTVLATLTFFTASTPPASLAATAAAPTLAWASDPVLPDDTVLIYGDGFGPGSIVELAEIRGADSARHWQQLEPVQGSEQSLKFVLPAAAQPGVFACRVRHAEALSNELLLNAPDPWWAQGDGGEGASPGGWIRVLGKCLGFGSPAARLSLTPFGGSAQPTVLTVTAPSGHAPQFEVPATLAPGDYTLAVHNGRGGTDTWTTIGPTTIAAPPAWPDRVFNVAELGLDGALAAATEHGGGIIYFPRGRYRQDGPIAVPPRTVLRGEGMGLVSLYWEDLQPHPEALISGHSFAIEDLSLYCQNMYRWLIRAGGDRFALRRVRVRANPFFMLRRSEPHFRGRVLNGDYAKVLDVLRLEHATNFEIVDCDLLAGRIALALRNSRHGLIARNRIQHGENGLSLEGTDRLIIEHNEIAGADLASTGNFFATYWANAAENLYFADNVVTGAYGSDRELMTFDAAGAAYFGRLAATADTTLTLATDPEVRRYAKEPPPSWAGGAVCILDGRGAGQYRRVVRNDGRTWEIDRPFTITPDDTSLVSIVPFRGRVLYIGNRFEDGGAVQLYGSAFDCIFAGNTGARMEGFTVWGKEAKGWSWQPSFNCQFLDNTILEGNGYGGRQARFLAFTSISQNHDDYAGPLNRGIVFRRNAVLSNGHIAVLGATADAIVEHSTVRDSDRGIEVGPATAHVLLRRNTTSGVEQPLLGDGLPAALVLP